MPELCPKRFAVVAAAALALAVPFFASAETAFVPHDPVSVNAFDRAFMFPYSATQDRLGDVAQVASFLVPAAFAAVAPGDDWGELALLYAGSSALALGSRFALKELVTRERPYMYFDDPPADQISEGDGDRSFPSGHCIVAFNGAAFTATVFALKYPDSPYRLPVTAVAYSLAAATAVLRVTGGSHFVTDVAAGALVGSLTGFIVPFVFLKYFDGADSSKPGMTLAPLPSGVSMLWRY